MRRASLDESLNVHASRMLTLAHALLQLGADTKVNVGAQKVKSRVLPENYA
jgi:hypothetical protein